MGRTAVLLSCLLGIVGAAPLSQARAAQPAPTTPVVSPPPAAAAPPVIAPQAAPVAPPTVIPVAPVVPKPPAANVEKATTANAERTYRAGVEALRAGRLDKAEAISAKLLELQPQPASGRQLLGMVKAKRGDLAGAVAEYDKALVADPKFIAAREERAVALSRLGLPDKARSDLEALKAQAIVCGKTCKPELRTAISRVEAALAAGRPPTRRGVLPIFQRRPRSPPPP